MISAQYLNRRSEQRAPADLDLRNFFGRRLGELLRDRNLSRPQFVEALSENLGEDVSLSRLDNYIATTKASARLPAYFVRAICETLDDDSILLFLARPRLQKQIELAEKLRELRRICDELLRMQELTGKRNGRSSPKQTNAPGNGNPADRRRNGNGSCAR